MVFRVWLLIWLTGSAAAQTLTFEKALNQALERNHQVLVARNTAAVSENNAFIGNANLLPSFSASGGATYSDVDGSGSTASSATLSAAYTIFDGWGNVYRYKSLQADKRLGWLNARDQIESTLLQVSQAYYAAASAYENWLIARELLSISQERLDRSKKRASFGQAGTLDVLAAQVDLNTDSVTVAQARFVWDQSRRELNVLLNQPVNEKFSVDTVVVFSPLMTREAIIGQALKRNASYLAAGQRTDQARFDYRSAISSHLPRLDLAASYGLSQTVLDPIIRLNDPVITARAGLTVSLNLFNGLKTHIQRQNAQISMKNQEILEDQARLDLEKDVTSAFETAQNSLLVLNLEKRSLEVAELNFKRTHELYQLGQVTTTQFREAQLNLVRAKSALSTAKYEARLSQIDLMRLSGQLVTESQVR